VGGRFGVAIPALAIAALFGRQRCNLQDYLSPIFRIICR
jgi:hypothetical protein